MSNQEILEKAIQKAVDGGWKLTNDWKGADHHLNYDDYGLEIVAKKGDKYKDVGFFSSQEALIFNHDFAKALWGEHEYKPSEYHKKRSIFRNPITGEESEFNQDYITYDLTPRGYKHHLQQMVIADEPIKYLGENIGSA